MKILHNYLADKSLSYLLKLAFGLAWGGFLLFIILVTITS